MYCVNCGVRLADTEKQCPLCGTAAFHPDLERELETPLYPPQRYPVMKLNTKGVLLMVSTLYVLAFLVTLLCDLQINRTVTWSGYVMGALLVSYEAGVLPCWFRKPNPVIFVPCGFAVVGLYLLYIDLATGGQWFLSFAFPVTGFIGLIVTTVVVLLRYVPRSRLYTMGGAFIATGAFMPLLEFLIYFTFDLNHFYSWSMYPLVVLVLLGGMLLLLAIHKPTREMMERKFFL